MDYDCQQAEEYGKFRNANGPELSRPGGGSQGHIPFSRHNRHAAMRIDVAEAMKFER